MEGLPERERKHACTMCHKRFDRPSTLKKHLLVHTGEKAYQCDSCGRRFGVASNLNRHVKRCILRTSPTATTASSTTSSNTPSPPPPPTKRRRRAPSPTFWVPASLRGFVLLAAAHYGTVVSNPSPLDSWDERDSCAPASLNPYHPAEWAKLPGPAFPVRTVEWQQSDYYAGRAANNGWGMGVLGVRVF
ncbi:hypothetical protein CPB85DRAFT_1216253 [Mucidula mucida]|nr:hypothetical protein CPB85DRAFT_1216253 [Mucidula mucida]